MSQPFTIYDTKTGEAIVCASPTWAKEQVEAGRYSYEPVERRQAEATADQGPEDAASEQPKTTDFSVVSGIGDEINRALHDAGIDTWAAVRSVGAETLEAISGMNRKRVQDLLAAADETGGTEA